MNINRIITASIIGPVAITAAFAGVGLGWDGDADASAICTGYIVTVNNVYSPETVIIVHTPAPSGTWSDPYKLETVKGNTAFTWTDSDHTDLNNEWVAIEPAECLQTPPTTITPTPDTTVPVTTTVPAPEPTAPEPTVINTPADPIPATPVVDIGTPAPAPTPAVQGVLPVTGGDWEQTAWVAAFAAALGLVCVLGGRRRNAAELKVITTES